MIRQQYDDNDATVTTDDDDNDDDDNNNNAQSYASTLIVKFLVAVERVLPFTSAQVRALDWH
jgi:hypothetical protein